MVSSKARRGEERGLVPKPAGTNQNDGSNGYLAQSQKKGKRTSGKGVSAVAGTGGSRPSKDSVRHPERTDV